MKSAADWNAEFDVFMRVLNDEANNATIGRYLRSKYRRILAESGDYYMAARNLRRQGYPLAIARLILFGRV